MKNIFNIILLSLFCQAITPLFAAGINNGGSGGGGGSSPTFVSANITQVGTANVTLGQNLMVSSIPVVNATDQTPVQPISYTGTVITRPANSTAYVAGQLFYSSTSSTIADGATVQIARANNLYATLYNIRAHFSSNNLTNGVFRVHFYNSQPTFSSGDGGNWLTASTGYIGCFDITLTQAFTDGANGKGIPCNGSIVAGNPVSGNNYAYYAIEVRAAYTPSSGETAVVYVDEQ